MTTSKKLQSASPKLEEDQRERSDLCRVTWTALKVTAGTTGADRPPLLSTTNTISKPTGNEAPEFVSGGTAAVNRR